MKTYRFWFQKDREFPKFMRLRYEEVEVSLRDVLTKGIHPLELTTDIHFSDISMLSQRLLKEVNEDRHHLPELAELGYCPDIHDPPRYTFEDVRLQHTLKSLSEHVFYVERLSYAELLDIARKALARKWDHKVAAAMVQGVFQDFNSIRDFLKSKDKNIKLSGYSDLDRYALNETLSPEDFANHEKAVIHHALPTTNFRSAPFLSAITTRDGEGLFSLVPHIKRFEIVWREYPFQRGAAVMRNDIRYNCTLAGNLIRFVPSLPAREGVRETAEAKPEPGRSARAGSASSHRSRTSRKCCKTNDANCASPQRTTWRRSNPLLQRASSWRSTFPRSGLEK